ncbi:fas-binding factor 1 homolog [Battus philenor]|uniref:fas-binding factor 1 homolog n=1 Tax=Battus philenor TaxID=42288 RepID=UPI0035D11E9D
MSFNMDDPLAGILSDGSDDSFFDDDILGKKKTVKKKSATVEKKSALFDLETVSKDKSKDIVSNDNIQNPKVRGPFKKNDDTFKSDSPLLNRSASFKYTANDDFKKEEPKDSKSLLLNELEDHKKTPLKSKVGTSKENIDILDSLMGPKEEHTQVQEKKGSQSLLDDILGTPSKKTKQISKPATVKNQQYNFDNILEKTEPKEAALSKKTAIQTNEAVQQRKTKSSEDWLGIFEDKNNELENDNIEIPSWLGGNSDKKKKTEKVTKTQIQRETVNEISDPKPHASKDEVIITKDENRMEMEPAEVTQKQKFLVDSIVIPKSDDDITAQGAALYLQQQEAQLMVALQLKAQDEKLAAMQMKQRETQRVQREAAFAQHTQLEEMLQKQVNHRLQMQAIINAHQDRISKRIRALLETNNTDQDEDNVGNEGGNTFMDNNENPRNKEKKQLLQLIQSLQDNHDKEIDLMETSYRRQLAFLEISLNQTEERMKDESDKVVKFYSEKINWLEEHHHLYKKWTEENVSSLVERHSVEKEMLRQQHLENVKVLQEHHTALMENIKNAVKQEQVLMRDSAGFSTDIQQLLGDIKENKLKCEELVEKVSTLADKTQQDTEKTLQIRETQISDMIQQLKKEREYFEKEKTESKDMIHMLEVRLKQMTTMIEEETASLKQKKMEFEFEKATFNKQTEFAKNVLKKQDEEVKMLKDDIQKEYQEKITKINEERAAVIKDSALHAKEKASVQSLKLQLEKTNAELEVQLQELAEERSKLNLEKQELHMEEQRILAKGKDLEILTKTALEKQTMAEKKLIEAENQQRKYEEKIRRLQEHVVSLNTREKQIAREKISLSRERISLHNDWKRMEGRQQCSLCRSMPRTQDNLETAYAQNYEVPASRDYNDSNMNHAFSAIEQEMAHLMGRTLGLRHDTGLSDVRGGMINVNDVDESGHLENVTSDGVFKDYMDPKFMMLRLDVQKVINNLEDKGSIDKK